MAVSDYQSLTACPLPSLLIPRSSLVWASGISPELDDIGTEAAELLCTTGTCEIFVFGFVVRREHTWL